MVQRRPGVPPLPKEREWLGVPFGQSKALRFADRLARILPLLLWRRGMGRGGFFSPSPNRSRERLFSIFRMHWDHEPRISPRLVDRGGSWSAAVLSSSYTHSVVGARELGSSAFLSPLPSPRGEGETWSAGVESRGFKSLVSHWLRQLLPKGQGECSPVGRRTPARYSVKRSCAATPSPWGEGRGEGELGAARTLLDLFTHFDRTGSRSDQMTVAVDLSPGLPVEETRVAERRMARGVGRYVQRRSATPNQLVLIRGLKPTATLVCRSATQPKRLCAAFTLDGALKPWRPSSQAKWLSKKSAAAAGALQDLRNSARWFVARAVFGHPIASPSKFRRLFAIELLLGLLLVFSPAMADAAGWENGPGYRRLKIEPVGAGKDGFTLLAPKSTGILFTNFLSEPRGLASQILPSGSGVAAGDVDGDGLCDLYFCALKSGNRLYRNLGNWKFEDITQPAGVACTNLDATGAALVDIDGDGDLDLIVNSLGGGTHVFFNDGHGKFNEAKEFLNQGLGGMSLALADFDGDGWLDLYLANYRVTSIGDQPDVRFNLRTVDGRLTVASINDKPLTDPEWTNRFRFDIRDNDKGGVKFAKEELGEPDALYRNLGGGRFERVPFTGGAFLDEDGRPLTQAPLDWGLSVMFRDLNNDGRPDLYICNDFATPDRVWMNQGGGRFQAISRAAIRQTPLSSMAVDVADINRDGFDDLFVVDMLSREHRRRLVQRTNMRPEVLPPGAVDNRPQYSRNVLQLNRGDGTYAEIAQFCGLESSEWSWAPIFLDVDLDGYEDLLVANGFLRDNMNLDALDAIRKTSAGQKPSVQTMMQQRRLFPPLATPKMAFRNLGGLKFAEMGRQWGFNTPVISQGMCLADLDNDGDMDVIANNLNSAVSIYRNDSSKPRVAVSLKGLPPNTHGIGAKIRVHGGPIPVQSQEIISGGRYLSCDQAMRTFAAGSLTNVLSIEVDWPSRRHSTVPNVIPNYIYEIDESGSLPSEAQPSLPAAKLPQPFFEDVSSRLSHRHHEDPFDDFLRQPTLPKRLSQLGPGVCWCDLAGNGRDDLVIASGKGGRPSIFLNDGKGGFRPSEYPFLPRLIAQDETSVLELPGRDQWRHGPGRFVQL